MNIFTIRNILLFIIAATAIYIMMRSERVFTAKEITPIHKSDIVLSQKVIDFTFFPDGKDSVIVFGEQEVPHFYRHSFHNLRGDILSHNHFNGYQATRDQGQSESCNLFADTTTQSVYAVINKNGNESYLIRSRNDKAGDFVSTINRLYTHPVYHSLRDSFCFRNGIKFYPFDVLSLSEDSIRINRYRDGWKITISKNIEGEIDYRFPPYEPFHHNLFVIAEQAGAATGKTFTAQDIHWIYNFFARNKRFHAMFFSKPNYQELGFCPAEAVARVDGNHDGYKDLLIYMKGYRWVNALLMCYDEKNYQLLWKREITPCDHLKLFKVTDIDSDGRDDILYSTGASYNAPDLDYYDKWDSTGVPLYSYFRILNADGTDKIINHRKVEFQYRKAFTSPYFVYLKEKQTVVLAIFSSDYHEQRLYTINLITNQADTLPYTYQKARFFQEDNETIILLSENRDSNNNLYYKKQVFSRDMNLMDEKFVYMSDPLYVLNNESVSLFGKPHFITPYGIFNYELEMMYRFTYPLGKFLKKDNGIICILANPQNPSENALSYIVFSQAFSFERWALYVLFFEIFLLGCYYLIKHLVFRPINTGTNSYFELYSVFGKMYFWLLQGNMGKIYKIPNRLSYSKETFMKLLNDLGGKTEPLIRRRFLGTRYEVYEIPSKVEWIIIQRIAHDMKNRMLSIGMNIDLLEDCVETCPKQKDRRVLNALKKDIAGVSETAGKLSQFSHLERLNKEPAELNGQNRKIIDRRLNHPKFRNIRFVPFAYEITVELDQKLFEMAFDNLLDNALDVIQENEHTDVIVSADENDAVIRISNPAGMDATVMDKISDIGFSTKKNGSGLGIPIAKQIIEKHSGSLELAFHDGVFAAVIKFPRQG